MHTCSLLYWSLACAQMIRREDEKRGLKGGRCCIYKSHEWKKSSAHVCILNMYRTGS